MSTVIDDSLKVYRKEFPITSKTIFLDHAAVSPMSRGAANAIQKFVEESYSLGSARFDVWGERVEEVRSTAASLIGAKPGEIAFVPNTSTGINHVARGLSWYRGEKVVAFSGDFPANVYPWMNLVQEGVEFAMAPESKSRIKVKDIADLVGNNTKLLTLSTVMFSSGVRNDLEAIGSFCCDEGVLFFVDGIQSLGAFPMDVKRCNIDFLAADSHKWLLGPEGAGILYISEVFGDRVKPAYVGWKSVENALEFLPYHFNLRKDASRFEPGSLNLMEIFAMGASMSLIMEIGVERIAKKIIELTDKLVEGLEKRGWKVISPRNNEAEKSGIVAFEGNVNTSEVVKKLSEEKIIIAERQGRFRVSPHFYNTFDEIETLLEAVGENPV